MEQESARDFRKGDHAIICDAREVQRLQVWPGQRRFKPMLGVVGQITAIHSKTMDIWFEVPYLIPGTEDDCELDGVLVRIRKIQHVPGISSLQLVGRFPEMASRREQYPWLTATFSGDPNEVSRRDPKRMEGLDKVWPR